MYFKFFFLKWNIISCIIIFIFSNISGSSTENQEMWLEIGSASLGPFILELASSLSDSDKNLHLVQHKYDFSA